MSELGLGEPQEPEEQPQEQETEPERKLSKHEEQAASNGWTDQETWEANGNHADDWKSAREFNRDGEYISTITELRREHENQEKRFTTEMDQRLAGVKKMHDAQVAALKTKRDEAVESADTKAFNTVQKQLDDLTEVNPQPVVTHNPELDTVNTWNSNNAWVNDPTPKAAYAKSEFARLNATGMNASDSLREMEQKLKQHFPDAPAVNERRNMQNRSESPRRTTSKAPKSLSMADVTSEEKKFRSMFGTGKDGEKLFLQAVQDTRVS